MRQRGPLGLPFASFRAGAKTIVFQLSKPHSKGKECGFSFRVKHLLFPLGFVSSFFFSEYLANELPSFLLLGALFQKLRLRSHKIMFMQGITIVNSVEA